MICKWCGARVDPAKKTCGRCGRKNMPLSDCGGFYDVVPNAPRGEQTAAPDVGMRPTPIPMPVPGPAVTPGWMKIALGVLAAGVVLLGVLSIGQLGRIRELEDRERRPVIQDYAPGTTEPGTLDPETTIPTDPVETEPIPQQPTEPMLPLGEDLDHRLEAEGMVSAFVKEQLQRIENWDVHAQQWADRENGPWSEGTLGENLEITLENAIGDLLSQEEAPKAEGEDPTEPPEKQETPEDSQETGDATVEPDQLQDAEG